MPAPRILNERTGCSTSSLSQISASASTSSRTSGVRIAVPSSTSRARRISSIAITARPPCPTSSASARRSTCSAAARSSTARPSDLKTVSSSSERRPSADADQELADLGADVLGADRALALREQEVARLVDGRLAPVDEQRRVAHRLRCRARASSGCSSRRALTCTPSFSHSRCTIGSAAEVAVTTTSASRTASSAVATSSTSSSSAAARPGVRLQTTTRSKSRTARIASRCALPWMPAPRIASVRASLAREQPRRDAGDGRGADGGDAARVQERARLAGLAVEERDEALMQIEAARRVRRARSRPSSAPRAASRRRGAPASAPSGSARPAGGRRSAAGCAPRRARATRAPRPSPRCTRPSAAAAARRARRGSARSCEEPPIRSCVLGVESAGRAPRAPGRAARRGSARRRRPRRAVREHPRERERRHVDAARLRLGSRSGRARRRRASSTRRSYGPGRCVMREPSGNASPRRYLPVSQPPGSGPNGTYAMSFARAERQHVLLVAALEQRERVLEQRRVAVPSASATPAAS